MVKKLQKILWVGISLVGLMLSVSSFADSSDYEGYNSGSHHSNYSYNDSHHAYRSRAHKRYKRYNDGENTRDHYTRKKAQQRQLLAAKCLSVSEVIEEIRSLTGGKVVGIRKMKDGYRVTVQDSKGRVKVTFVRC